ncbi:Hsp20/alpha crystallin family protein [Kribbella sp.]|uniref:Hsp20/alpha crystallin family protein n=1 Tax=Kribbella sp. TaxID=1871183 RepID=UPI002D4E1F5A|nr:Hsp20/alpha crystallin family protein [Kribbella sp.]HZX02822.1 Hsp20/alpha crystallin family protein [Kribbella sp.]
MMLPIRLSDRRGSHDVRRSVRLLPSDPYGALEDWSSFPVDVEETEDAYIVEIDLPGIPRQDVTLEITGRELTVSGEIKEHSGFLHRQTRRSGRFHHAVSLPGEVDVERIKASLDDGVLMVRAPKSQAAKAHRIQIDSRRPGS